MPKSDGIWKLGPSLALGIVYSIGMTDPNRTNRYQKRCHVFVQSAVQLLCSHCCYCFIAFSCIGWQPMRIRRWMMIHGVALATLYILIKLWGWSGSPWSFSEFKGRYSNGLAGLACSAATSKATNVLWSFLAGLAATRMADGVMIISGRSNRSGGDKDGGQPLHYQFRTPRVRYLKGSANSRARYLTDLAGSAAGRQDGSHHGHFWNPKAKIQQVGRILQYRQTSSWSFLW